MKQWIYLLGVFLVLLTNAWSNEPRKVLSVDEAFTITSQQNNEGVIIDIRLGEGIYLYDDKLFLELTKPQKMNLTERISRPQPEWFHNTHTQRKSFQLFISNTLLSESGVQKAFSLKLSYQGCSEMGICYQPLSKEFAFKGLINASLSEQDEIVYRLMNDKIGFVLLSFFGFGLLLSLTPCIFPMVPILSSIIISQPSGVMSAKKGFIFSLVYVLSMSLAYTIAGIMAALFGSNIQASMQNPWVIVSFSLFFVALAFSMFGLYEIKMPLWIQNKIHKKTGEAQTKGIFGIAIMGFLSALIVGPCVAAPLAGALMYIGQSGDALLGGSALFVMSLGMGVPLLLIGTTAGKYMPRPGVWMQSVSIFFGIVLLAVALWMLSRVMPTTLMMALWSLFFIVIGIYFGAIEPLKEHATAWQKGLKSFYFVVLLYGIALFIGFLSGSSNLLSPFEKLTNPQTQINSSNKLTSSVSFEYVKSYESLMQAVQKSTKPVMVDFYADWCVNCIEFDQLTFSDPRVKEKLDKLTLLKIDVTKNSEEDKKLQKAFTIYGPPAILFFKEGKELQELRLVGFKNADEFLAHISRVGL